MLPLKATEIKGGYSWEFLVRVCCPVLQILTLFQTKNCYFLHPFSDQISKTHTHFQTWLNLACYRLSDSGRDSLVGRVGENPGNEVGPNYASEPGTG